MTGLLSSFASPSRFLLPTFKARSSPGHELKASSGRLSGFRWKAALVGYYPSGLLGLILLIIILLLLTARL